MNAPGISEAGISEPDISEPGMSAKRPHGTPLTILSVAYPFAPVGPTAVGGAEVILSELDRALTAAGHRSLVVACEGSAAAGTLFPAPLPAGVLDEADREAAVAFYQAAIDRALASTAVDLVHMHGLVFDRYRLPASLPVLVTLHMPPGWYAPTIWTTLGPNVQLQCVSKSQLEACPLPFGTLPVIENGVALPSLWNNGDRDAFALALGRICPEKNLHAALEAGTLARTRVLIGGQVFPYRTHLDYFDRQIAPLLGGEHGHAFLGPLEPARKVELLARAQCLLLPTLSPETSSLVAMEALAAGTPVIAFRSGALPDIVEDGVTGLLVDSVDEMAEALRQVRRINRAHCRRAAEVRFSRDRMIAGYFALYAQLTTATGRAANTRPARAGSAA